MAVNPATIRFAVLDVTPDAPAAGYCIMYFKSDNILYCQDSAGTEIQVEVPSDVNPTPNTIVLRDGSGNIKALEILDSSSVSSADIGNRQLNDSSDITSLSWQVRQLYDSSGNNSLDWQARQLWDSSGNARVNWATDFQVSPGSGNGITLQLANGGALIMQDSGLIYAFSEVGSGYWELDSDGAVDIGNNASDIYFDPTGVVQFNINGNELLVADPVSGININGLEGNGSAQFTQRVLYDTVGDQILSWSADFQVTATASNQVILSAAGGNNLLRVTNQSTPGGDFGSGIQMILGGSNYADFNEDGNLTLTYVGFESQITDNGNNNILLVGGDTGAGSSVSTSGQTGSILLASVNSGGHAVMSSSSSILAVDVSNGSTVTNRSDNTIVAANVNSTGTTFTTEGNGAFTALYDNSSGPNTIQGAGNGAILALNITGNTSNFTNFVGDGSLMSVYVGGGNAGNVTVSNGGILGGYIDSDNNNLQCNDTNLVFAFVTGAGNQVIGNGLGDICGGMISGGSSIMQTGGLADLLWVRSDGSGNSTIINSDGSQILALVSGGSTLLCNDQGNIIQGSFGSASNVETNAPGTGFFGFANTAIILINGEGSHGMGSIYNGSNLQLGAEGGFWAGVINHGNTVTIQGLGAIGFLNDNTAQDSSLTGNYSFAAGSGLTCPNTSAFMFGANFQSPDDQSFSVSWNSGTNLPILYVNATDIVVISDGGGDVIADFGQKKFYDQNGVASEDFANRALLDSSAVISVDWDNRQLSNNTGNVVLDWSTNFNIDTTSTSNNINIITNGNLNLTSSSHSINLNSAKINATLNSYDSDASAGGAGGLVSGDLYQTSGTGLGVFAFIGVVMVKQ